MLAEIQVSPRPYGTDEVPYANVHPALQAIKDSGLRHEVHGLGTVVEGDPDEVWALLRRVHEACLEAGADANASYIKVHQHGEGYVAAGHDNGGATSDPTPTFARLTRNWR